jgi:aspartate/methionine/tyrosine aminotransferase
MFSYRYVVLRAQLYAGMASMERAARRGCTKQQQPRLTKAVVIQISKRVMATDEPCIVKTKAMMANVQDVVSLAQGVVYWTPPDSAVAIAQAACGTALAHSYGPANGNQKLWDALIKKVSEENGLESVCSHACCSSGM